VQANPPKDIHGIGVKTADQIAQKVGIPVDSLVRACAGLNHVLLEATGNGHCALPVELLKEEAGKLLLVDEKLSMQLWSEPWPIGSWCRIGLRIRTSSFCHR
jgi:Helix-hairpin-helix containing domain